MKPPTRKRATRSKDLHVEEYSKWNLSERQRLLKALEKYPVENISKIAKMVVTKSESEVIYYISKLKRSLKSDQVAEAGLLQSKYIRNIETWLRFTYQLVDGEEENYSSMIGKLLALYGDYCFKRTNYTGVNFKLIYDYLAGLLLGVHCPVLPPLESALILDLLKDSATILTQSEISFHKKCVLMNYKKHMYPDLPSTAESEQMIMSKLLVEDLAPPGFLSSSLPSQAQKQEFHKNLPRKRQGKVLSDSFLTPANPQPDPGSQSGKPKPSSASSVTKRKLPPSWKKESSSSDLTASPEAKQAKILSGVSTLEEIQTSNDNTLDQQNPISEKILSTSETVKSTEDTIIHSGLNFSEEQEKNDFESQQESDDPYVARDNIKQEFNIASVCTAKKTSFAPSVSGMQSDSSSLPVTERENVQHDQDQPRVGQLSTGDNIQIDTYNDNANELAKKDQISLLSNATELSHLPRKEASDQVTTADKVSHLVNMGTIKKDEGVNNATNSLPSVGESTAPKKTILSSLLKNPNEFAILERIRHFNSMIASKNSSNQNPKGSSVHKKTIPLNPSGPSGDTVQEKINNVTTLPKSTLNLQTPSGVTISKEKTISNPQNSSGGGVQQQANFVKVFQITNKGLVVKGSVPTNPYPVPNSGNIQKEARNIKVSQVTNEGPNHDVLGKDSDDGQCINVGVSPQNKEQSSVSIKHESDDGDAYRFPYKPCVTWLNPINIPEQLINLKKARKKMSN